MKVTPISEADARASGLWKRGLYDFEVLTAIETQSKVGNDMIEMEVRVFDTEGKGRTFKDWLVSSESTAFKVRHFAAATGLLPQYERGELKAFDCVNKTGRCQIGVEYGKQIPGSNDKYPDKNKIQDYAPDTGKLIASAVSAADLEDSEIPF